MLRPRPVHIDASATTLLLRGMPRVCRNRWSGGPSQRFPSSQRSSRGELRAKRYDAAITNTVVGSPGTNTPMMPIATDNTPREA